MRRVNERTSFLSYRKGPRSSLLRFVCLGGKILYDKRGDSKGRGAYLFPEEITLALKGNAFERAFKKKLTAQEKEEIQKSYER